MDAGPDAEPVPAKANFDGIYDAADPRRYFRELGAYDYTAPHYGQQVFRRVLDALPGDPEQPRVVDLCCSYGINAALLKHDIELRDLYHRYGSDEVAGLSTEELAARDRPFYASRRRERAPEVIGLDAAGNAVAYAVDVGLLDHGVVADLEGPCPAPGPSASAVGSADLLTVTGGIGYITERTFDRVLGWFDPERPPWVASLCLRTVPFAPIAERLAAHGLVTEQLDGVTVPQRRFTSEAEHRYALQELDVLGVDPTGREADGAYHANVFLSRPARDVGERPIDTILDDLTRELTQTA
jgi:SAM-dependent methyltransferase